MKKASEGNYSHVLIMGDFNYPGLSWEDMHPCSQRANKEEQGFAEAVMDCFLLQHVTNPTRVRVNQTPSLLDLVFTNEEGMILDINIGEPVGKSDHCVIEFKFNYKLNLNRDQKERYSYERGDYDKLRQIVSIDWEQLLKMIMQRQPGRSLSTS